MTDEMRKKLTEKLLGECWHNWIPTTKCNGVVAICNKCGHVSAYKLQRFFDSDADMLAVFRAIRDKGKWADFINYARIAYKNSFNLLWKYVWEEKFTEWLFLDNPERACCLAAMFLEEQR